MPLVPQRLATKLIISLTVILVAVDIAGGILWTQTQERQTLDAMILGADQLSRSISSATWYSMLDNHRAAIYQVMQTIALKQGINRIRIFNKEGRVMFSTSGNELVQVDKRAEACVLCHDSEKPLVKVDVPSRARVFSDPQGHRQLGMVTPIYNEPACSDAPCHAHPPEYSVLGVLDVVLNLDPVDLELAGIRKRILVIIGIQIVLTAALVIVLTRRFVDKPIQQLREGARAVSAMQLDTPIRITTGGELQELAGSMEAMRVKLKKALDELNQFTQRLEEKVKERTEQLEIVHQKLLQTARLASLGQLSASVAHEVNNPISGILNLSMLMQRILRDDGIPQGRVQEFRQYLTQVTNETSRVGKIVSDLLAFSRRSRRQRALMDLNVIIRNTVSLVEPKLRLANVEIVLDLQSDLPLVYCDGSQIQQVILNLVMNASEATHGRGMGRVEVRTRAQDDDTCVVMKVSDNGEGIRRENLSRIFDPFFTTKEEGKGVGLGLSVVFGIVRAHDGDIDVQSTLGTGTTITLTLPLGYPEAEHPSSAGGESVS